jgi:hypothetical protein
MPRYGHPNMNWNLWTPLILSSNFIYIQTMDLFRFDIELNSMPSLSIPTSKWLVCNSCSLSLPALGHVRRKNKQEIGVDLWLSTLLDAVITKSPATWTVHNGLGIR